MWGVASRFPTPMTFHMTPEPLGKHGTSVRPGGAGQVTPGLSGHSGAGLPIGPWSQSLLRVSCSICLKEPLVIRVCLKGRIRLWQDKMGPRTKSRDLPSHDITIRHLVPHHGHNVVIVRAICCFLCSTHRTSVLHSPGSLLLDVNKF